MKVIVDLEKKSLKMLENERSIFRGEYGADKLELYINKQLVNEYPTITALLSNGRKIGAYSTDEAYGTETIDGVTYTTASFTLSKENGFTLSEGQMQITIWMNSNGKKEAIGNVLVSVINTTAFDDGDIIVSGDVAGTLVNYKVELENLQSQINTSNINFTNKINNLSNIKADKTYVDTKTQANTNKIDNVNKNFGIFVQETQDELQDLTINFYNFQENTEYNLRDIEQEIYYKADKTYVDGKFNQILGEGASETLDTIGEISKALEEHNDEYDSLLAVVGDKANKEDVMNIVNENSTEVDTLNIGTSDSYDETSDNEVPTTKAVKKMIGSGGSSGGGKTIVNIQGDSILEIDVENDEVVANFSQVELNNKYIIWDLEYNEQAITQLYDGVNIIIFDFSVKNPKNSTILLKVPYLEVLDVSWFMFIVPNLFVVVKNLVTVEIYDESTRLSVDGVVNYLNYQYVDWVNKPQVIKIDFDEFGFATIYLFDEYEV